MSDAATRVDVAFQDRILEGRLPQGDRPSDGIEAQTARLIFRAQCRSRHLDLEARRMQMAGEGFYTIGSSGHEAMAAVAAALRSDDMAFLHYRDAAFQLARAAQLGIKTVTKDMLMSFACSREDPISGGRHKVLGSKTLNIPPQTSTIASHLPKAVGTAFSQNFSNRFRPEYAALPPDGLVVASFGDASANHATAQAAFNTAAWTRFQRLPLPLIFICEDNGIGISTPTPEGWIAARFSAMPGLSYITANGLDFTATYTATRKAAELARRRGLPVFLHLRMLRLFGHAGNDIEAGYRPAKAIYAEEADDPLLHSVRLLADAGIIPPQEALAEYNSVGAQIRAETKDVICRPRLQTSSDVMASLIPPARTCIPAPAPDETARRAAFGPDYAHLGTPQTLARLINWTLTDLILQHGEIFLAGQDIGRKGGVYGVTQKLQSRFGSARVIDTLLDEQSILGLAIGAAQNGFVPIPEIQFLAYLHNAEDQLRGEAATLPFFSDGQFANPMVVRIAGLGYQRGFGGHFHNDNSLAVLRDIPGLILGVPSDGAEAAGMLREAVRLAREEQRVCVIVEPIALYHMRDLHPGDGQWLRTYQPGNHIPFGTVRQEGEGTAVAVITYGNGRYLCAQALSDLTDIRHIDLRWLSPLPFDALKKALRGVRNILVVDECRRSGNISESLMSWLFENGFQSAQRITAEDSFIATGPAYAATLPSSEIIRTTVKTLLKRSKN